MERIILGIDPGTTIMGFGLIQVERDTMKLLQLNELQLSKYSNHYLKLSVIFNRTLELIDTYKPDELAIEAPFFGKNVQSMLKLGRAQGVAIAAAIHHEVPIQEYAPLKIKMAITGNGSASKEQVAGMLQKLLHLRDNQMPHFMDATDAVAAAYCHFLQMSRPTTDAKHYSSWKDFARKNIDRIK